MISRTDQAYATELHACRVRASENLNLAEVRQLSHIEGLIALSQRDAADPMLSAAVDPPAAALYSDTEYQSHAQYRENVAPDLQLYELLLNYRSSSIAHTYKFKGINLRVF